MFSDLWSKIKELVRKMLPKKNIQEVLQVNPCVSDKMGDAIELWSNMYIGEAPWLKEPTPEDPTRIVSMGIPALIASEKARMATLEMKSEISAPMEEVDATAAPDVSSDDQQSPENTSAQPNPQDMKPDQKEAQPSMNTASDDVVQGGAGASTIPMSSAFQTKTKKVPIGPTERADFLNSQYKKLLRQIRRQLEYGIAKGGLVIKPYIVLHKDTTSDNTQNTAKTQNKTFGSSQQTADNKNNAQNKNANNDVSKQSSSSGRMSYNSKLNPAEIEFDFIQADRFFPLAFDANGKVIEAAFVQTKEDKANECVYLRLEYHKLEGRKVIVQNLAFKSDDMSLANSSNVKSATNLGTPIPLTAVSEWATLEPITTIEDVDRLLFAYFRMPEANTIDPYSPLGVSGYSRVVSLIRDADMQYSRLLWEFEGGELAIDVDRDALKFVTDPSGEGHSQLTTLQSRLFRKVDLNAEDTYNVFAPQLRDVSITHGLNTILTRIEDAVGFSRGTLSEVNSVEAKTATELKILKQRSYATNADIQTALQAALEDVVYVMDVYCELYDVTPSGEYEVSFEWDDSIIVDSESELSKRITLMQNGLASKLENRMWYFGETENQARAALQQIDEESTQAMLQNVQAEIMKSQQGVTQPGSEEEDEEDDTKSPSDTTSAKKSKGKQADSLDNPIKGKE